MSEGPDRLRVQAFRATSRRVKCARFHPILSVVALADKDELLQVWDFESKQVIFEAHFGDDPPKGDLQTLAAAAEQGSSGKAASSSSSSSHHPAGGIRDLAFCDTDVLHWESSRQASMRGAPAPGTLDNAPPGPLQGSRFLAVLCEHRVVLVDLLCGSRRDLPRSSLDGKPPCALAVARRAQGGEPLLCVGTTDGSVRCVPLRGGASAHHHQQPPSTLVSPSKSPPTCIVPLSGASASGGDKLLAGTADGSVLVWDPLGGGTGRDVSPQTSHKAHEGAVLSMALLPPRPDRPVRPQGSSLRLATLGAENRVAIWALAPFQELSRAKPLSKVSLCSVSYTPHGAPGLLLCSSGAQVYRLTEAGALEQLCSLSSELFPASMEAASGSSSSSKASVKASLCLTHPSRPNLAAVACSAGLAVLSFGPAEPPPAVGLLGSASAPSASDGISYAVAHNGDLWAVACKAAPPAAAPSGGGILATEVSSCVPVAKLPGATGRVTLSVSPCGRLVSACWPETRTGIVYRSRGSAGGSEPWEKVWEGQAASLAWSGQGDHTSAALMMMEGRKSTVFAKWRSELLSCLANVEAVLDFGEDAELGQDVAASVIPRVRKMRLELQRHLSDGRRGQMVREGVRAVLLGPTNAGKSSILNFAAGRDAAIVSPHPGTTRDVVEVPLELGGYKVLLSDSAGIRDAAHDPVESEGILRAFAAARSADVVVMVVDIVSLLEVASEDGASSSGGALGTTAKNSTVEFLGKIATGVDVSDGREVCGDGNTRAIDQSTARPRAALLALNKADLLSTEQGRADASGLVEELRRRALAPAMIRNAAIDESTSSSPGLERVAEVILDGFRSVMTGGVGVSDRALDLISVVTLSCRSGEGGDALLGELRRAVEAAVSPAVGPGGSGADEAVLITRHRHRQLLQDAVDALFVYEERHEELELAAEELRLAARCIGSITGTIETEEVLEAVFSEFCIGK